MGTHKICRYGKQQRGDTQHNEHNILLSNLQAHAASKGERRQSSLAYTLETPAQIFCQRLLCIPESVEANELCEYPTYENVCGQEERAQ